MIKTYDPLKQTSWKISFQETKEFRGMKKFGQKFVFEQKFARKTLFPWEHYNDWDSNLVSRLVPTVLHLSLLLYFEKMTKVWTCRRKLRSSTKKML